MGSQTEIGELVRDKKSMSAAGQPKCLSNCLSRDRSEVEVHLLLYQMLITK